VVPASHGRVRHLFISLVPFALVALALAPRLATAALATDVIVPVDAGIGATSITTPAFSTHQPNELLLAFIATDGKTTGAMSVTSVTGGGLTWTLVRRTNVQLGTSEVWRAFVPSSLTGVAVRAALAQSVASSMTVVSFTGADPSGAGGSGAIGATAGANARPGAPAASLVTTRANSWTWGVGNDWDGATPRTVPAPQVKVHEYLSPTGDTFWAQRQGSPSVPVGTTVTINDTAPTGDRYNLTVVEVLPSPASGFTIAGSVGPGAAGVGVLVTLTGAASLTTSTDATGAFAFGALANGTYTVTPSRPGYTFDPPSATVTVTGADVTGLAFTATAVPTYTLSGTITPAANGAGSIVSLGGSPSAVTSADASGAYAFPGLPAGTYTVTPSRSGYVFTPASAPVTITSADITGIDFAAAPVPPPPLLDPNLQDFIPAAGFAIQGTGAARVLQYTHDTFNGGPGPLVIQPTYNPASGNYQGVQYVYSLNGTAWTIQKRIPVAGAFVFHAAHGHFHFPFASYGLYDVAPGGGVGTPVALSPKTGFCIDDSYLYAPALPNAGAIGNLGSCSNPTALRGLDIGAVDEYDKSDPGQSIPLSGVANGTYWFKAVVDPENFFEDADPSNQETDVLLAIADSTVTVLQTVYPVLAPPPAIALASPLEGSAVTGIVDLTVTTAVTGGVQYLVDGLPFGAPVADPPGHRLAWNTGVIPNGTHWLAAQVTDANGRIGTSPVVSVTVANSGVADTIPPIVALDDPEPNSFVSAIVSVSATVASDVPVTGVQFLADGVALGAPLTAPPYVTTWNTQALANGPHVLTVTATDASGLTGSSGPVTVVVNNTQPPDAITKDVVVSVDGLEILQTPAFSTSSADEWLVAFAAYAGPATGGQSLSIGGAGLAWKLLVRSNTQSGTSEIWAAHTTRALTNVSVTCAPVLVGYTGSLTVIAFGHVSGPNIVNRTSSPGGAPDVFLPGVSAGSWVFAVGNDPLH